MKLTLATIGAAAFAWTAASAIVGTILGRVVRLADGIPQPVADRMCTVPGLPQIAHDGDCREVIWQARQANGVILSLVTTGDGRLALFAADMDNFVAVRLERDDVQQLRHAVTGWLVDSAAAIRP